MNTKKQLKAIGLTDEQVDAVLKLMQENMYITVEGIQAAYNYQQPELMANTNAHNFVIAWWNYNKLEPFTKEQRHIISNVIDTETRSVIFWLKAQGYVREEIGYTKTYYATDKLNVYISERLG